MGKIVIYFCIFIVFYNLIPTFFGGVFATLICILITKLLNGEY